MELNHSYRLRAAVPALILLILFAANGRVAQAQQTPDYDPASIPVPAQMPITTFGAQTFLENCAPCHGQTGLSDGPVVVDLPQPPPPFAEPATTWERSPAEYFHTVKFGRIENLMPPWGNQLDDQQIWQAVYYAWSLHTDAGQVETGSMLYAESCASCHGPQGAGDGPDADGELPDFSDAGVMMARSPSSLHDGWTAAHPEIGADWSASEQWAVLDYVRTFTYVPPWESPYRVGSGVVTGRVIQGTDGGADVADTPVTLRAFINFADVASFVAVADAQGSFAFDALMTDPSVVYLVETNIDGVRYSSDFFEFTPDSNSQSADITIYESGSDGSSLFVPRANWVIDFEPGVLVVGQIYTFGNQDDRTFTGVQLAGLDRPITLMIPILPGAELLEFPDGVLGDQYLQVDDVVYDTRPVPPGDRTRQFFLTYRMPIDDKSTSISFPVGQEVTTLNLLVADLPGLEVEVVGLEFIAEESLQGANYLLWEGENISGSSSIDVTLDGALIAGAVDPRALAQPNSTSREGEQRTAAPTEPPLDNSIIFVMGGVLLTALAGIFVWSTRTSKRVDSVASLEAERKALLHEIAALDDSNATGELDDDTWAAERARLKTRLLIVSSTLQK